MTLPSDGLTASIMAVEGVVDCRTLLNGPLGCKFYHGHISDRQFPGAPYESDPQDGFRFGQKRVPCTFLDEYDYIHGTKEKLTEVLRAVAANRDDRIVLINSPGASLIGDDIEKVVTGLGLSERVLIIESPGLSEPVPHCFDATICALLSSLDLRRQSTLPRTVNLLGLSIMHRHWRATIDHLTELLSKSGISVNTVVGAGCSTSDLRRSATAALNIVVCEEYALSTADWYSQNLGIPYSACNAGAPLGFDATEEWIGDVGREMQMDMDPSLKPIRESKSRAARLLAQFDAIAGLPKGATFGIKGDASAVRPLTKWLLEYLGMAPEAISVLPGGTERAVDDLERYLKETGFIAAWGVDLSECCLDVAVGDGHTISQMRCADQCRIGIELSLPSRSGFDFSDRTYFGEKGAMNLLDDIINGFHQTR